VLNSRDWPGHLRPPRAQRQRRSPSTNPSINTPRTDRPDRFDQTRTPTSLPAADSPRPARRAPTAPAAPDWTATDSFNNRRSHWFPHVCRAVAKEDVRQFAVFGVCRSIMLPPPRPPYPPTVLRRFATRLSILAPTSSRQSSHRSHPSPLVPQFTQRIRLAQTDGW